MTIDEAIKHCEEVATDLESYQDQEGFSSFNVKRCKCAADLRQLAEWLTELKERRNGGWISCKERMPKPETMVIVACYGSDIVIPEDGETVEECCERLQEECVRVTLGFIGSDGWYDSDYCPMMVTPSFWQPLPEPPEGGSANG